MDLKSRKNDSLNRFSGFSIQEQSVKFDKDEDVSFLIQKYIQDRVAEARKEGAKEAYERLQVELNKLAGNYLSLVTKIVDFVRETVSKNFSKEDLKILESRARFDFYNQEIAVLFIIDADLNKEFEFSNILSRTEQEVLEVENSSSQLIYINVRDNKVDNKTIQVDYPFLRKIK